MASNNQQIKQPPLFNEIDFNDNKLDTDNMVQNDWLKKYGINYRFPISHNGEQFLFKSAILEIAFDAKPSKYDSKKFNVSFKCKNWHQILKSNATLNFFVKPSDL